MANNNKFQKGKVYQIFNMSDDDVYIGSTVQPMCRRMGNHRSDGKKEGMVCIKLYTKMEEYGFWEFFIEIVEEYPCAII